MNRVSPFVLSLFLVFLLCALPVLAQTNQGFEWGVNTGDEIHFMFHAVGDGMTIDEEIYIVANATTTIPDFIIDWTEIPRDTIRAYYANGTQMGIEVLIFVAAYNILLPIGNWALISTLAHDTLGVENYTEDSDDPFFWGYSWEDDNWTVTDGIPVYSNYTLNVHVDYLKVDGFLSHYSVDSFNTTTKEKTGEATLVRMGLEQYTETTSPTLNHPADIEYTAGQTGNSITWSPSDEYPGSYQILLDGSILRSGTWNSTTESIVAVVDGHAVGEYNYTVIVADVRGNTAVDEVMVTVVPPPFDPMIAVIAIAAAGVVIVIVAVAIRRR